MANLRPEMLSYMSLVARNRMAQKSWCPQQRRDTGLVPTGTAYSYNGPKQTINEDFATLKGDYNPREGFTFGFVHHRRRQQPFAAGRSAFWKLHHASLARRQHSRNAYFFTDRSEHLQRGFLAGRIRSGFVRVCQLSIRRLSFVTGQGPGGIVIGGGTTTTGAAAITSPGPNNAAGARNRRNLFTFTDGLQISRGIHQFNVGGWFQKLQDNENTASRRTGVANFASLTTFLQGTTTHVSRWCPIPPNWLSEAGSEPGTPRIR